MTKNSVKNLCLIAIFIAFNLGCRTTQSRLTEDENATGPCDEAVKAMRGTPGSSSFLVGALWKEQLVEVSGATAAAYVHDGQVTSNAVKDLGLGNGQTYDPQASTAFTKEFREGKSAVTCCPIAKAGSGKGVGDLEKMAVTETAKEWTADPTRFYDDSRLLADSLRSGTSGDNLAAAQIYTRVHVPAVKELAANAGLKSKLDPISGAYLLNNAWVETAACAKGNAGSCKNAQDSFNRARGTYLKMQHLAGEQDVRDALALNGYSIASTLDATCSATACKSAADSIRGSTKDLAGGALKSFQLTVAAGVESVNAAAAITGDVSVVKSAAGNLSALLKKAPADAATGAGNAAAIISGLNFQTIAGPGASQVIVGVAPGASAATVGSSQAIGSSVVSEIRATGVLPTSNVSFVPPRVAVRVR